MARAIVWAQSANVVGIPFTTGAYNDGSLGAPLNGSFMRPTFFTGYAQQSGQTYVTRPPWKVAGVDYAIGIPAASLPLKDPSIAALPTGCSYNAGVKAVVCQSSSADVVLDGYDFSLSNGTFLQVNASFTGNMTIQNCNFGYGTNLNSRANFAAMGVGVVSLTLKNCVLDGGGSIWPTADHSANTLFGGLQGGTPSTVQYCAFLRAPARMFSSSGTGSITWKYNYGEGLTYPSCQFTATISGTVMTVTAVASGTLNVNSSLYAPSGVSGNTTVTSFGTGSGGTGTYNISPSQTISTPQTIYGSTGLHGDPQLFTFSSGTMALFQHSYSTFLSTADNLGGTACVTPFEGSYTSQVMTLFQVDHSTLVANTNLTINNGNTIGYVLGNNTPIVFTNTTWDSNYIDYTGAFGPHNFSAQAGSGTPTITNNINLTTGAIIP